MSRANLQWRDVFDGRAMQFGGSQRTSAYWSDRSFEHVRKTVLGWVAPARGATILDAGCGVGAMSEPAVAAGAKVIGLDFSFMSLAHSRRRGLQPVCGDLTQIGLRGETIPTVICVGVIQQFDDCRPLLAELFRVTQRGGELFLLTTNPEFLPRRLVPDRGRTHYSRFFSASEVSTIAVEAGWHVRDFLFGGRISAAQPGLGRRLGAPWYGVRLSK